MMGSKGLVFAFCLLLCLCAAECDSKVKVLTSANFDDAASEAGVFVEFYAPWCGWCKKLAPVWEEFAESQSALSGGVVVAKVDATVHKGLAAKFGVRGFPTLKFFKGDKVYDFKGERNVKSFQDFANQGYKTATSSDNKAVPGKKKAEKKAEKVVEKAAPKKKRVAKAIELKATAATFPTEIGKGYWFVKMYAPWCGHCKSLAPTWDKLAAETDVNIAKINLDANAGVAAKYGIKYLPTLLLFKNGELFKTYDKATGLDVPAFTRFLDQVVPKGEEQKAEKKETKAEKKKASKAIELQGTPSAFFNKIAKGYWIVDLYTTWCGHCKKVSPIFDELAGATDINVAKIDLDAKTNSGVAAKYGVKLLPTVILFKDGYEVEKIAGAGAYDVAGFQAFINKHRSPEEKQKKEEKKAPKEEKKVAKKGDVAVKKEEAKETEKKAADALLDPNFPASSPEEIEATKKEVNTMLMFHSSRCEHCKTAMPEYKAFRDFKLPQLSVKHVSCDVDKNRKYCDKPEHKLVALPTIRLYKKDGTQKDCKWPRHRKNFKRWYQQQTASFNLTAALENPDRKHIFVMFHATWCSFCKAFMPAWLRWSKEEKWQSELEVRTVDCDVFPGDCARGKALMYPTLGLFVKGRDQVITFQGERKIEKVIQYYEKHKNKAFDDYGDHPNILEVYQEQMQHLRKARRNLVVFLYADWCGHCKKFKPLWEDFAAAMKKQYPSDDVVQIVGDENKDFMKEFDMSSFPQVMYLRNDGKVFKSVKADRATLGSLFDFVARSKAESINPLLMM